VRMALGMGAVTLFDSTFLIVTTVFIMVHTISLPLTLWALLPLPLMALATERLGRIIHRRFLTVQAAFSDVTDATQENFAGIRVIKGFAREAHELERFGAVNRAYFHQNMALVRVWGLLDPLVDFISGVSFATALGYGGMLVLEGRLSLGSFVAFTSYLGLLQWPMMAIGQLMNILQRGAASLERLNAIFREQPEIVEGPVSFAVEGRVEFRHLTFRYDEDQPPVLTDVNVVLEPGQTLGIVGRTGSGKSTLVNLLLRLYDPPPGTVFIDGHDVRELSFATLRESIGYVPSDNFLFSDTIAENVAFGRGEMSRAEIERVTELAQVRENILAFPDQFDTLLGERGITLSGGQKQRVSIARALAKDPAILILDDALSAVDTATEDAILKRLREVRRGRTNIVIAHRISTVQDADRIIVLDGGRVIQSGTHDELLQQDGLYRALYERQLLEARVEAAGAEEGVSA
jgi:ATP-binding cassette subfamily B multidrug efflux pump